MHQNMQIDIDEYVELRQIESHYYKLLNAIEQCMSYRGSKNDGFLYFDAIGKDNECMDLEVIYRLLEPLRHSALLKIRRKEYEE